MVGVRNSFIVRLVDDDGDLAGGREKWKGADELGDAGQELARREGS